MSKKYFFVTGVVAFGLVFFSTEVKAVALAPVSPVTNKLEVVTTTYERGGEIIKVQTATPNIEDDNQVVEPSDSIIGEIKLITPRVEDSEGKFSTPGETIGINPQPEPPKTMEFKMRRETREKSGEESVKLWLQQFASSTPTEMEIIPSTNSLVARFEHNNNKINIPVRSDFKMENGKLILEDGGATYTLKMQIPDFYKSLDKGMEKIGLPSSSLHDLELNIEDKKPVYNATVEEDGKLFGFIPLKLQSKIKLSADGSGTPKVIRPWYARLMTSLVNFSDLQLLPNLAVTGIKFEPEKFKAGDMVTVIGTVTNDGPGFAVGGLDVINGKGPGAELLVGGNVAQWYYIFLALNSGESQDFKFTWKSVVCDSDVGITVANGDFINETTKADNVMTVKAVCQ